MSPHAPERVASLDLIRGVAVLGIFAINIAGFAGPGVGVASPHLPTPGTYADEFAFAVKFVVFEGKMRALFTMLFGAGLVLFVERAEARGRFGDMLQLRRLLWLALFGLGHFYLLWWGDILFLYAACGILALLMRDLPPRVLTILALSTFGAWQIAGAALDMPEVAAEQRVLAGTASIAEVRDYRQYLDAVSDHAATQLAATGGSFADHARYQLGDQTLRPFTGVVLSIGETLPLMLLGMALCKAGFFSGDWPRRRMLALALAGTLAGLVGTVAILGWAWPRGFPPRAMEAAFLHWTAVPHLLMATGYAALLVMAAPGLAQWRIGRRIAAAGRMAFSNYLGTTLVMTAIFYGWGLGLGGSAGHAGQWAWVLFGWTLMLAWSSPWLARFRRGPLEWLWRSLTEMRLLAFRR